MYTSMKTCRNHIWELMKEIAPIWFNPSDNWPPWISWKWSGYCCFTQWLQTATFYHWRNIYFHHRIPTSGVCWRKSKARFRTPISMKYSISVAGIHCIFGRMRCRWCNWVKDEWRIVQWKNLDKNVFHHDIGYRGPENRFAWIEKNHVNSKVGEQQREKELRKSPTSKLKRWQREKIHSWSILL